MPAYKFEALDATGKTKTLLDGVAKKLGGVPNIVRTMATSPAVLEGYLGLSGALGAGRLPAKLREQLALAVVASRGAVDQGTADAIASATGEHGRRGPAKRVVVRRAHTDAPPPASNQPREGDGDGAHAASPAR